ncbi:putative nudix domain-containing protein [Phaeoacremonium minimum UCRPA7]|uniref:Putative nudix domain-containing protein n=1 Tax=Phaeoacremonium minimum (strain UCR-PA7) TaxID=1286976 RepID=R8BWF7_PHAM7|nr:putative nudix domain-containing protein [Phaeoacremonium minimum UCRPA7]EOO03639.1 putative nudix domain-containing protein [Phaeoacremonium minimum UCRPA7]
MTSATSQPTGAPTTFIISPELNLSEYNLSIPEYLAVHPSVHRVGASVIVFHGPHQKTRWEVPGGATEHTDATLLHAGARELWEEAGLRMASVRRCVDATRGFVDGGKRWRLITFEAEVDGGDGEAPPPVTLDPEEHVAYLWATEEEVRARRCGDVELDFAFKEFADMIMGAFEERNRGKKVDS